MGIESGLRSKIDPLGNHGWRGSVAPDKIEVVTYLL